MIMDKPIEKVDICERGILMKKLVCVCLSLALLVSLAACAAEETPEQRIETSISIPILESTTLNGTGFGVPNLLSSSSFVLK